MKNKIYYSIKKCRICGNGDLRLILDFGLQPPANFLRDNLAQEIPVIPLRLKRCDKCASVQLGETVNPEFLFRHYVWVTGTSPSTIKYSEVFYNEAAKRFKKNKIFVVEIASNDGTFLKPFKQAGHKVLGVDPAVNIAKEANKRGIDTTPEFFGLSTAQKIKAKNGEADCVFARNVIPHVENVHDVVAGMAECLSKDGVGIIEFHYSPVILKELHYDSIYHEHYLYHSLKSIAYLLNKHGLNLFDAVTSPISGGSLVVYFSKNKRLITSILRKKYQEEFKSGVNTLREWRHFSARVKKHGILLNELINKEIKNDAKIIGYGASARSSTILNYCKIDNSKLIRIADNNPIKHNKYTPGSNIKIVSPQEAFSVNPDVVLLLAWNFQNEIIEDIKNKMSFRGKIILPLPYNIRVIKI